MTKETEFIKLSKQEFDEIRRANDRYRESALQAIREQQRIKQQTISKVLEILKKNKCCFQCGTIAYGNGKCHCGKNDWRFADYEHTAKQIKELKGK